MKILSIYTLLVFSFISIVKSQEKSYLEESKPLSPTAYQFLKYTALPVSEYSGIPKISVPIYEINVDGVKVPVTLNYHASGITVNEESTSVGLGWNLQFGSVVQIINSENDLNPKKKKVLLDYIGSSIPSALPLRHPFPNEYVNDISYLTVGSVRPDYTFPIATGPYFPINGEYGVDRTDLLTSPDSDFEPDIFKANFFGYSVNFIKDFTASGRIVVLNKAGYSVKYLNDDSWCITVPSGVQYFFALKNIASSTISSSTKNSIFSNPSYAVNPESTVIWSLTKIITANKKEINFNYLKTDAFEHIPGFSQTWKKAKINSQTSLTYGNQISAFWYNVLATDAGANLTTNIFTQKESHIIPSSITFPLGRIDFYNSDREDVVGGKKIDSIRLSSDESLKVYKLKYSYLNSSDQGGNEFAYDKNVFGNTASLRLKLDSFTDNTGGIYQFNYDPILLPNKTSYAQDQWGYYNGSLNNTSLIPNPVQYRKPELGDNGNNHSANESFAKASSLKQIIYPTGGSINFDFELNSFDNNWVPDYTTSDNTISHGNGLRIKSISWKQPDNTISKTQKFEYSGGKTILPINLYRNYEYASGTGRYVDKGPNPYFETYTYFVEEFNANGYYSPSSLATINGVGYDQVSSKYLDQTGNSLGTTITSFNNNVTILPNNSVQFMAKTNISVPGRENMEVPKNSTVKSVQYLDKQGKLKKKLTMEYTNYKSRLFYGARIQGYGNYIYVLNPFTAESKWSSQLQRMVAEYPIYDFESLQNSVTDVEYYNTNDSLVTRTDMLYNDNRLLNRTVKSGYNYKEESRVSYPSYTGTSGADTVQTAMLTDNFLSVVTARARGVYTTLHPGATTTGGENLYRSFAKVDGKFLPKKDIEYSGLESYLNPSVTTYDIYDNQANVLQLADKTGVTSLKWGYDSQYLIAEIKNAKSSSLTKADATNQGAISFNSSNKTSSVVFIVSRAGVVVLNPNYLGDPGQSYSLSYSLSNGSKGDICVVRSSNMSSVNCSSTSPNVNINVLPGTYTLTITLNKSTNPNPYGGLGFTYPSFVMQSSNTEEFFVENFEENQIIGTVSGNAHTGKRYYNGNYTTNFTKPNGREYTIQWWSLSGSVWVYNSKPFITNISLTGPVDDVRIFPSEAQIKTYTYKPLVGMTSMIDSRGQTTYYEYDNTQRLKNIKDQKGNIIKSTIYHYKD
ncbi:hypothetical protein [Pedobacter cryoconitis]|uniref:hypothetical protein n=1 Tax=Pedobacter cryoconitis TaxID=188932 RepID=UPI001622BACE|nr:hypothetical protein [Pedobacter cryoconitis]MBB5648150.1 hypothetical protein [Pedobacter cryoconitis]